MRSTTRTIRSAAAAVAAVVFLSGPVIAAGTHHLKISFDPHHVIAGQTFTINVEALLESGALNTADTSDYDVELSNGQNLSIHLFDGKGSSILSIDKPGPVLFTVINSGNASLRGYQDIIVKKGAK